MKRLVLAPAERADVLVDFSTVRRADAGDEEPQAAEAGRDPGPSLEQVMQIRVGTTGHHPAPAPIPAACRPQRPICRTRSRTRYITLNEIDTDEPTLVPEPERRPLRRARRRRPRRSATVEDWVYVNMTGDTHPMHTHLVTFQVIGRTPFDVEAYEEAYERAERRARRDRPDPVRDRSDAAARPRGARIQGHGQGEPRHVHDHPRQVRPAGRRDRTAGATSTTATSSSTRTTT